MFLRALKDTQVNKPPHGLVYVNGPVFNANDRMVSHGDVVEVADDFQVNPEVFEHVEPIPGSEEPVKYRKCKPPAVAAKGAKAGSANA